MSPIPGASLLLGATSATLSPLPASPLTAHGLPGQVVLDPRRQPPQPCPGRGFGGPRRAGGARGGLQQPQAVLHQRPQLPREAHGPAPQQELLQQLREIPHQPGQQHELGEQSGILGAFPLGMVLRGKEGMGPFSHLPVPVEQQRRGDSHSRDGGAGAGICSGGEALVIWGAPTSTPLRSRECHPKGCRDPPAPSPLRACSPSAVTKISSSVPKLGLGVPTLPTSSGLGRQEERVGRQEEKGSRDPREHCLGLSSSPPAQDGGKQQLLWMIPCEDWPDEVVVHKFLGMRKKEPVGAHSLQRQELSPSLHPQGWEEHGFPQHGF